TSINNPAAVSAKKRFGMTFTYGGNTRAYNGNIASVQWNTKVAAGQTQTPVQTYSYSYDMLSRLKKAAYTASGKTNFFNEELAYDVMGNIDTLRRTNGSSGWYNHFKYTYVGNQLTKVTDAGTAARSNTFSYDANGNGRTDSRLGITEIQYNYLNLPKKFVKGTQHLLYTYDALGNKRTKTLGAAVTEYVDGIQYKNGIIEFIQTEEGRILPSGSSFIYEYFLKDHLGNTRAVIDHTGAVKQIQDYYAFGMEMNTGAGLNTASNLYKYNGKEKQVELKLDQLDYGARFYNAEIGRWSVIDPLGEMFEDGSLYNYGLNNPLLMVDPTGLLTDTTYVGQSIAPVDVTARKPNRAPHLVEQREIDLYTNISKSVSSLDQRGAIVNSNFEAVKHYYWGKGLPANIGKSSLLKILSSPKFIELHKAVSKGRFKAKQGINVTEFEFHVGRTTISIIGDPFTQTATYTIFEGDGFW
ncbi:RHS repeat-associated core domain-containing protein, partial [Sphingobacterium shayense]|uniref:RHS repeat domain-containing protein n=1 Tax=Sphingobacterium shayense TaxID=626343 RepID=UPI001555FD59